MKNLGDKARWPKWEKTLGCKDKSKWCAYHEDFGHVTEYFFALKNDISYLLKRTFEGTIGKKKGKYYPKIPKFFHKE